MKKSVDNYYSIESDRQFMSCSQYDMFLDCEAKYKAYLDGIYKRSQSIAFLEGNYIHSWAEGKLEEFQEANPEMFSSRGPTKGSLKSNFIHCETMIQTLKTDKFCMLMLQGESEITFTGEIFGVPWKIRVDKWQREKNRIVDLKTTKSITEKEFKDGQRVSFIEFYNYLRRAAIYAEIVKQNTSIEPSFYIVAVSKESTPDKAIINLTDPERYALELDKIKQNINRIKLLRAGIIEPVRCEQCDFCKETKILTKVINYKDL